MFKIVNAVDFVDLRTLYVRAVALEAIAEKAKLRPGEALLFTNTHLTRFRIVANVNGIVHLFIPGTDEPREYYRYQAVAKAYLKMAFNAKAQSALGELVNVSSRRLKRLAARISGENA